MGTRLSKEKDAQCHDQGDGARVRSTYELDVAARCLPSQFKAQYIYTSLLSGIQVKEAKEERAEVARTHIDKVTKGKVNSMGKRKQHFRNRKCKGLHPFKASQEKEMKNILAE